MILQSQRSICNSVGNDFHFFTKIKKKQQTKTKSSKETLHSDNNNAVVNVKILNYFLKRKA